MTPISCACGLAPAYRSAQLLLLKRLGGKILVHGGAVAWRRGLRALGAKLSPCALLAVEVSYDDAPDTRLFVYVVAADRELRYQRFANR